VYLETISLLIASERKRVKLLLGYSYYSWPLARWGASGIVAWPSDPPHLSQTGK
jgi:hypothetical protein